MSNRREPTANRSDFGQFKSELDSMLEAVAAAGKVTPTLSTGEPNAAPSVPTPPSRVVPTIPLVGHVTKPATVTADDVETIYVRVSHERLAEGGFIEKEPVFKRSPSGGFIETELEFKFRIAPGTPAGSRFRKDQYRLVLLQG